jgi:hypothetical protein
MLNTCTPLHARSHPVCKNVLLALQQLIRGERAMHAQHVHSIALPAYSHPLCTVVTAYPHFSHTQGAGSAAAEQGGPTRESVAPVGHIIQCECASTQH